MSISHGLVSWAKQRPLGPQIEPPIDPTVMIYHIIVGSADAGYGVFKPGGYAGDESTFIVCGPRDVAAGHKDGELWQIQNCRRQADAQFAGNAYADSVETSGMPNEPFSSAMMETLIRLTAEWCDHFKRPCKLVPSSGPIGPGGLGYHELRADWNTDHHVCPGAVREGQIRQFIIPKTRHALGQGTYTRPQAKAHPAHMDHIQVDGVFGTDTISAVQHVVKHHFHLGADFKVDGIFGPDTRHHFKMYLHDLGFKVNTSHNAIGEAAVHALQKRVGAKETGKWSHDTTKQLQTALNHNKF